MNIIVKINLIVSIIFSLCYFYQLLFIVIPFIKRKKPDSVAIKNNRFAVLISARNEEKVITELIETIKKQTYPAEFITTFVVADNCSDNTATAARNAGAVVFERFDTTKIGKGYALNYLLGIIKEKYTFDAFDGYFVFDADNLLDENYISEMNKTFCAGHKIITSYRNSKNYSDNWISAGYSLWFLRESQFLNNSRMILGTSCAVSGTGFMVSSEIINKNDGWNFFLLTEDIEFTVHSITSGERIAFCKSAVLFDEQPTSFKASWNQRLRWAKGFLQVFKKYGLSMFFGMVKKQNFACFDMLMTIMPALILTLSVSLINISTIVIELFIDKHAIAGLNALLFTCLNGYFLLLVIGLITVISEWKQIYCKAFHKIIYIFTFPLFMFTYLPIAFVALFKKVEWKPIEHSQGKTLSDIRSPDNLNINK